MCLTVFKCSTRAKQKKSPQSVAETFAETFAINELKKYFHLQILFNYFLVLFTLKVRFRVLVSLMILNIVYWLTPFQIISQLAFVLLYIIHILNT